MVPITQRLTREKTRCKNFVRVQARGGNRGALVWVALAGRRRVGRPAVGDDPAARLDARVQERGQADRAGVGDDTQAGTADPALVDLHGGREQHLPESTTAGHARLRAAKEALVDLDVPAQSVPA